MSRSTEDVVRRTAELARLEITADEVDRLAPQFARCLEAFHAIAGLDVEKARAMARAGTDDPRTRADEERPSLPVGRALANAPDPREDFYSVPKTIPAAGEDEVEA